MDQDLRFPIGEFAAPASVDDVQLQGWIEDIDRLPLDLRKTVRGMSDEQLRTRYRPGGWTVAQVVHHLADSHLNSYTRYKLALTEERPAIRPYDEAAWGELPEARDIEIGYSLDLIDTLHFRWVKMLRAIDPAQWDRDFFHPESEEVIGLRVQTAIYAWHGRHHLAHVTSLAKREDWNA